MLVVGTVACVAPAREEPSDTAANAVPGAPTTEGQPWRTVIWHPHQIPVADYGRGVVAVAEDGRDGPPGSVAGVLPRTDTLRFRSRPDEKAPLAGLLLIRTNTSSSNNNWRYGVAAPGMAAPNLVEFGYEHSGIVIDSVTQDGRWVQGRLGTDDAGNWLTGWADVRDTRLETVWWAEHLPQQPLFALDSMHLRIALEPAGELLPPPTRDHIMHATDSVRGRWLLVSLVTPSDYCMSGDAVVRRTRKVWVEYLDVRGRPQVWYHSRGC
ncbi:MAG TPA: hypothetical protein VEB19_13795 [Gemmatimonadaceae bacterium]|nr:hypothetical protein [Gemmatimonadaceae bacterium]